MLSSESDSNCCGVCLLEGQVHGSLANGPGAMADSTRDGQQQARMKLEGSAFEVDGEHPLDDQKYFVGVGMKMPARS